MSGRIQWMCVVVLMLSAGFSGCFDQGKDDGEDKERWSLFERKGDTDEKNVVPVEAYERYWQIDRPDGCDGCISLERPPEEPKEKRTAERPTVQIPFPQAGDRVRFSGTTGGLPARDLPTLPTDHEAEYGGVLQVFEGDPDHARFRFGLFDAVWPHPTLAVAAHTVEYNVSLESRIVTNGSALGYAQASNTFHREDRKATMQLEPPLETLFWLGAHVWGRELSHGDAFTLHFDLEGESAYLHFHYKVVRIDESGTPAAVGPHRASATSGTILRVVVADMFGDRTEWEMVFDASSPYPVAMDTRGSHSGAWSSRQIPAIGYDQRIEIQERGSEELPWRETPMRPEARHPPLDTGFLLGERKASEALDRLPLYPLRDALSDLSLLSMSYRSFVAASPQRMLFEATYHSEVLSGDLLRHTWTIAFTDRATGIWGWSVSRTSAHGVLSPTADHHEQVALDHSRIAQHLAKRDGIVRLASGSTGIERLAAMGIDTVDHLQYRLRVEGENGVGGILAAYRHRIDTVAPSLEDEVDPLGYFVQDLATRRIIESGAFYRPY